MKNSDIEYKLSTNYEKLERLLREGKKVIGFIPVEIAGKNNEEYSNLKTFSYNSKDKFFNLGFVIFEETFKKTTFAELCERQNIRFIDLPESKKQVLIIGDGGEGKTNLINAILKEQERNVIALNTNINPEPIPFEITNHILDDNIVISSQNPTSRGKRKGKKKTNEKKFHK